MYATIDLTDSPDAEAAITARISAHADFGNISPEFAIISNRILGSGCPSIRRALNRSLLSLARVAAEAGYYCESGRDAPTGRRHAIIIAGDGAIFARFRYGNRLVEVIVGIVAESITRSAEPMPEDLDRIARAADYLAEAELYGRRARELTAMVNRVRRACRTAIDIDGRRAKAWRVIGTAEAGWDAMWSDDARRARLVCERATRLAGECLAGIGGAACA